MQNESGILSSEIDDLREKKCFIIMPISDISSYEPGHFKRVYEYIIKPAVIHAGFVPIRADENQKTNFIVLDILKQIIDSEICICDLSSSNPNVLYELGIRQAFNLPVTIIKDSKTPIIFDIQGLRDIEYNENLRIDNVTEAIERISITLKNTYNNLTKDINSLVKLLGIFPSNSNLNEISNKYKDAEINSSNYEIEYCVNKFLMDKEEEGLSTKTIKTYRYQLSLFMKYTKKNVNEIKKEDIRSFFTQREEDYSITSKKTMMTINLY